MDIGRKATYVTMIALLFSLITVQAAEMTQKAGGSVIFIKSIEEFDRYVKSGNFVVAYFGSATCGPCKAFHDTYYAMAKEYPDVIFLEICYGSFKGSETLEARYAIRSHPTFVFFDKSGNKKSSFSGASERTKAKIAGEISLLKGGSCPQSTVSYQGQPQQMPSTMQQPAAPQGRMAQPHNVAPQQMQGKVAQGQPMHEQQSMMQQSVQQPASQRNVQQTAIQQDVQPVITYHNAPGSATPTAQGTSQQRAMQSQKESGQKRKSRVRHLGRRQRQRLNNIEYQ